MVDEGLDCCSLVVVWLDIPHLGEYFYCQEGNHKGPIT